MGLPVSDLARMVLMERGGVVPYRCCAAYLHAVQGQEWFRAAFPGHALPVTVVGGRGISRADAAAHLVKIGTWDRGDAGRCEQACLHELAHIVTADHAADGIRREPVAGPGGSRGHHQAWRVNFVLLVRMMLGRQEASRLRREFELWGLPTPR